ncbi:MAG: MMPL family transporter [Magnetococcales bacterium]|nr:MMPL family transporter [Magnetococcales bacterium]
MRENFFLNIMRWRWLVLILFIALVGGIASGAKLLRFETSYQIFFSDDNPQLLAFEHLQDTYTKNDNVLFVLAPKDGKIFTKTMLKVVKDLTKASWQIPYSIRVDSITNFQHTEADGDDLLVQDLVEKVDSLTDSDLERIKSIALNEPLLLNRMIPPTADVTGVNVTIQLPAKDPVSEVPEVAAYVEKMAADLRLAHPDVDVYLTGVTMMNNAFPTAAQKDMATLVPTMFLVVIITLGIMFRSFSATFATVVIIMMTVATTMGLTGWLGIPLTGPSSSAPTIILTMAVADCVHIIISFLYLLRQNGGTDKRAAIMESLRINLHPVFLTTVTTAIGFLSMNFGEVPPFRDLGNMVAMGVGTAFILSITVLPALLIILPIKVKQDTSRTGKMMDKFGEFVVQKRNMLAFSMVGIVAILAAFIPNNELNDEFVKYFSRDIPFRVASDFSNDRLTGIYNIDYSLDSGEENGVSSPEFLQHVEDFANWYRKQPEVVHVNSITDIFKRLNRTMHGDDPAWYQLPQARDLAAQYLLLYEMSLPYGLDLNNQINLDKSATRFVVTMKNISTNQVLDIADRARNWQQANLPPSMQVEGSSPTVMFAHIGYRNIRSMLFGMSAALVLISMIMMISLRSVKIGLISLIPNLVPMIMAFGLWGMLVGEVGLALSIVTGMTLGIVVDDSVHFLSKYLRARRERGASSQDAVRYAFSTVGTALWVTSAVLVCGFFVLTFSDFKLNSGMGLLTAITISFALIADFLLLPPLLMKLEKNS